MKTAASLDSLRPIIRQISSVSRPGAGLRNSSVGIKRQRVTHQSQCVTVQSHCFATQNNASPKRNSVTPFNDDGGIPWSALSTREKTARAVQQTFNFGFVWVGLALTGAVVYFLWTEVFAPDSKITIFNRAVDRIKKDAQCIEALGESKKITAHGEDTANKWRRARPIASSEYTDKLDTEHLVMHFHVDGPLRNGIAQLHMIKRRNQPDYEYKYLFVDIKGHERIYLEGADASGKTVKRQFNFLGVKW